MDPGRFIDWIKLSPRHLLAVFLASAFLVFGRDSWVGALGLIDFREAYRTWISVPLLLSAALLGAHWATNTATFIKEQFTWRRNRKRLRRKLHQLSPPERAVLREYILNETKTRYFGIDDGVVQGLVAGKILYHSARVGSMISGLAHNIQPWAWDYLKANPHLLVDLPHELPPS